MEPVPLARLAGLRLAAFAGIASPSTFERTLRNVGARVEALTAFDDHHPYSAADLARLGAHARGLGVDGLVTTEKDWVRLRTLPLSSPPLYVLSIKLALISGESEWRSAFERACRKA
jgi:tetraacyldisaccharide-1-P 4'-kinase